MTEIVHNHSSQMTIGLVGNPNCGKSTLFNALTGAHQRVGNWPGVTVERKSGVFKWQDTVVEVVDLPGTYSLAVVSESSSIDERIACEYVLNRHADVLVNVIDASNLERNLYLTLQLIEMRVPVIVVANMMDVAKQKNIHIALNKLQKLLGCPVIPLEAHKGKGVKELKQMAIKMSKSLLPSEIAIPYPDEIKVVIEKLKVLLVMPVFADMTGGAPVEMTPVERADRVAVNKAEADRITAAMSEEWLAIRLLEDDVVIRDLMPPNILLQVDSLKQQLVSKLGEDVDILMADSRYKFIQTITSACLQRTAGKIREWTSKIDNVVLNRVFGIPIFLMVMYSLFLFAINIGGAFQDFFDIASHTIFVEGVAYGLANCHAPSWLIALLANGVGKGISTTLTFIPVIGAMFLALAFLEDSGYMARAAFVVDRLMRALGLPGKSFVPMIVGFGCNVPAVMAARTLENKRDRILTVMMSPFMSCGARLAIFAVFTAAFFPAGGQNVVFALYLIGIGMAMLTGLLLRKTVLKGDSAPLVLELPPYHIPRLQTLLLLAWLRLKSFVFRAGKLIVPICVLIGVLNALNIDGTMNSGEGDAHSWLSTLGQWFTPIFTPMGIHQDNWPATVGLLTGVLAKEVVVGTLNTIYSQLGALGNLPIETFHFWGGLQEAWQSIPANLSQLGSSLGNPVLAKAPVHALSQSVYGLMYQRFDGQVGAIAYLLFVLLYLPCVSTLAAISRELNWHWAWFAVVWTTFVAYGTAVSFYQLATFAQHPATSLLWIAIIGAAFSLIIISMRILGEQNKKIGGRYEFARN